MKSKKILTTSLVTMLLFFILIQQVWAYTYTGQKWNNPSTLTVRYDSSLSERNNNGQTYNSIFSDAFYEWSQGIDSNIIFQETRSGNYDIYCNVFDWGNVGWDGEATWYFNSNIIYLGNAKLNTYYTNGYTFNTSRGVAAHEIGHILGLDHVSSTRALMYDNTGGRIPTKPASDDINGVNNLYNFK